MRRAIDAAFHQPETPIYRVVQGAVSRNENECRVS
jgi:hypothetical protein